jgi:hypothetical protein
MTLGEKIGLLLLAFPLFFINGRGLSGSIKGNF